MSSPSWVLSGKLTIDVEKSRMICRSSSWGNQLGFPQKNITPGYVELKQLDTL